MFFWRIFATQTHPFPTQSCRFFLVPRFAQIRMDAYKLCTLFRRPHVGIAEDVGGWAGLMDMMSIIGVVNSVAVLVFTENDFSNYTLYEKIIIFLAAEQGLLMLKYYIESTFQEEPQWVADVAARNNFIIEKFAKGFEDAGDDMELDALKGQVRARICVCVCMCVCVCVGVCACARACVSARERLCVSECVCLCE
jgi:hypothetical protein